VSCISAPRLSVSPGRRPLRHPAGRPPRFLGAGAGSCIPACRAEMGPACRCGRLAEIGRRHKFLVFQTVEPSQTQGGTPALFGKVGHVTPRWHELNGAGRSNANRLLENARTGPFLRKAPSKHGRPVAAGGGTHGCSPVGSTTLNFIPRLSYPETPAARLPHLGFGRLTHRQPCSIQTPGLSPFGTPFLYSSLCCYHFLCHHGQADGSSRPLRCFILGPGGSRQSPPTSRPRDPRFVRRLGTFSPPGAPGRIGTQGFPTGTLQLPPRRRHNGSAGTTVSSPTTPATTGVPYWTPQCTISTNSAAWLLGTSPSATRACLAAAPDGSWRSPTPQRLWCGFGSSTSPFFFSSAPSADGAASRGS